MSVTERPAIVRVDFLRVPCTEVSEKICVGDDLVEFRYRSICTIAAAAAAL